MNGTITTADIAIVGAGMAGASIAAEIGAGSGGTARVVLIEGESRPGHHSTGRSAAFWSESYGGPAIQPLTSASYDYLMTHGFLSDRGALHLAGADGGAAIDALLRDYGAVMRFDRLDADEVAARIPGLRMAAGGGLAEPGCRDIDVAGLHEHYLSRARRSGATVLTDARVEAISREGDGWRIETRAGTVLAPVLVNAAGAWAGAVAAMAGAEPIAIRPYRRTVVQLQVDPPAPASLPLVIDAREQFYFKPEAGGRLWVSPHDETPAEPGDAQPEEIDVAIAIDRLQQVVDWRVVRRERAWAGLRSFAPDRMPVYGHDRQVPGFFWFAGQGGFGIQTAPAAAMIGAALLLRQALPESVAHIDPARYAPR